ncbi:hypothetical protein ACHAQA_009533 [Verticillium albo-atrum]
MKWFTWLSAALAPGLVASHAIPGVSPSEATDAVATSTLFGKRDDEHIVSLDFVKRWAAIGDSFTAGIGSGSRMGNPFQGTRNWICSRYTYTWPHIVNRRIGGAMADFQYPACSGARTGGVYEQAGELSGDLDVVMLTAGGNDLCLASMIKTCVVLPYEGSDACDRLIDKAQSNIDTILKDNIRDILNALKSKMKDKGIVVYGGYAPFFNTDNEDCATKQNWAMASYKSWRYYLQLGLSLTVERRQKFNELVDNINKATREVVEEYQSDRDIKYDIEFSDWSSWPSEVDGDMCSPSSDGSYPDKNQPEMLFFKPDTWVRDSSHRDSLRKRDLDKQRDMPPELAGLQETAKQMNIYDTLLYKSPNPQAIARRKLDARAPTPPDCPGDDSWDPISKIGVPDFMGRWFHPNEKGHQAIAAFALTNLAFAKAKQDGKVGEVCEVGTDEFRCWQKDGSKSFVSWDRLDANYKSFCENAKAPAHSVNWEIKEPYYEGTPEEFELRIKLSNGAFEFDRKLCLESFDRLINSCDGDDPGNPMNWKFGGEWKRGSYLYQINPKKKRELLKRSDGRCHSWWKGSHSHYMIDGHGWAGWDHGQETLLPAIKNCVGLGVTDWKFDYYDNPSDNHGWEWRAEFNTPIWTRERCFNNLKVQKGAGGYTHHMRDNQDEEKYEEHGCGGRFT